MEYVKKKQHIFRLIAAVAVVAVCVLAAPRPAASISDELKRELGALTDPGDPDNRPLTLDDCLRVATESNPGLEELRASQRAITGDIWIDKSRFGDHVDVSASFSRKDGNFQKDYFPTHHPQAVGSAGSASLGVESLAGLGGADLSSFSTSDLESLTGFSTTDISSLASQYGVDLSQFGFKRAGDGPTATPAERMVQRKMAERSAADPIVIDTPLGPITITDEQQDQIQDLLRESFVSSSSTSGPANEADNRLSMRYSRRLAEWGKKPVSREGIESNIRLAEFNYLKEERNVLSEVRRKFYTILLKQKQIRERETLKAAYEEKLDHQQKRYEVAKDVPMIDVLTAELDVLNEQLRINTLDKDLSTLKLELLQLLGKPLSRDLSLVGEPPNLDEFRYDDVNEIVQLTMQNSYQVSYLVAELAEEERKLLDINRDYKPKYAAKFGVEDRRSMLGLSVNQSDNTYGLDMGVEHHMNLTTGSSVSSSLSSILGGSGSSTTNNNIYVGLTVDYLLDDNIKKDGLIKKKTEKIAEMQAQLEQQMQEEELTARQAYEEWFEAKLELDLQRERMNISLRRLEITRKLREFGKVPEYQLDSYRNQFFSDQDRYFSAQEAVITAQENIRKIMGVFD